MNILFRKSKNGDETAIKINIEGIEIKINLEVAECVGLWLAEGDTKTKWEITFTNNCYVLVELFAKTMQEIFKHEKIKPRIYIYSPDKKKIKISLNCKINYYIDKRASKPYFIYRIGSTKLNFQWINIVNKVKNEEKFFKYILRGFFAGEGNLKGGSHSNRTIRIAQGEPNKFIEQILKYYKITYKYSYNGRSYNITGKWNWDKLANIKIADLHPIKKEKFWKLLNSYKEIHYPDNYLRDNILKKLNKPYTSFELSIEFNRSQARIQDILIPLKKENKIQVFYVKSKAYWIKNNQNKIIISKVKDNYLKSLIHKRKNTKKLAKEIGVCWKSAYRRLTELEKLNLVFKDVKGIWMIKPTKKEVIVL